jgi:vacuolar protein sorting-associated protein VTA1
VAGNYFVVDSILAQKLHSQSEECMTYTVAMMEKLERIKKDEEHNDAIHDEVAAQAYVEQFASEVYNRADNAVRGRKANKQTVDTFAAARTFLEVLGIWQKPLSEEVKQKVKYAKWQEVRILKAYRNGEDPNVGDDVPGSKPGTPGIPLDPNDPEVRNLNTAGPLQPTVEDVSDHEGPGHMHQQQSFNHFQQHPPHQATGGDVSPLEPDGNTDGYFPAPSAPPANQFGDSMNGGNLPSFANPSPRPPPQGPPVDSPQNFYSTNPSGPSIPSAPSPSFGHQPHIPQQPYQQHPQQPFIPSPPPQAPNAFSPAPQQHYPPPQIYQTPQPQAPQAPQYQDQSFTQPTASISGGAYRTDDQAVADAQKHAKWAISALNFDDVDTAVRELKIALRSLGAS